MPKISIVIPIYNASAYLVSTLNSLQNQTLTDFEVILVDDESTDNSSQIIKHITKTDNRFRYFWQSHQGAGAARNTGLKHASGKTVMFLDADDIFLPTLLEKTYLKWKTTHAQIIIFQYQKYDHSHQQLLVKKSKTASQIFPTEVFSAEEIANEIFQVSQEMPWNKLIDKDFLLNSGVSFQESEYGNDIYFSYSLITKADKISIIDDVLLYYVVNQKSSLSSNSNLKTVNCRIHAFKKVQVELKKQAVYQVYYRSFINGFIYTMKGEYEKSPSNEIANQIRTAFVTLKITTLQPTLLFNYQQYQFYQFILHQNHNQRHYKQQLLHVKAIVKRLFAKINIDYRYHNYLLDLERQNHCVLQNLNKQIFDLKTIIHDVDIAYNSNLVQSFCQRTIKTKTVLLVEVNNFHGEVLAAFANYFLNLGYNVDVLIRTKLAEEIPLANLSQPKLTIWVAEIFAFKQILSNPIISKYEHLFFNSELIGYDYDHPHALEYFHISHPPRGQIICVAHYRQWISPRTLNSAQIIVLNDHMLNQHYPATTIYSLPPYTKNNHLKRDNQIQFLAIGNISNDKQRNPLYLFEAIKRLIQQQEFNFQVIIVGRQTNVKIPDYLVNYFTLVGKVDYQELDAYIKQSDYLLTLLDPEYYHHERYLNQGITGTFPLSFGYAKPCLIPQKFATHYHFNQTNALIIENDQTLDQTMKKAIHLTQNDYANLCEQLEVDGREMKKLSLNRLKKLLNETQLKQIKP